jgi:DNA-binding transcriptional LysR family regulator
MAILPEIAVSGNIPNVTLRPLRPPIVRTLALIEHRNKPNEPALEIVRNALLELRTPMVAKRNTSRRPTKSSRRP